MARRPFDITRSRPHNTHTITSAHTVAHTTHTSDTVRTPVVLHEDPQCRASWGAGAGAGPGGDATRSRIGWGRVLAELVATCGASVWRPTIDPTARRRSRTARGHTRRARPVGVVLTTMVPEVGASSALDDAGHHSVLICHSERPDGRSLAFMYAPIIGTLVAGFRSLGVTDVRVAIAPPTPSGAIVLSAESRSLRAGDTFLWVGPKAHYLPPWAELRAAGVRRVYYQTEPLPASSTCLLPPARRALPLSAPLPTLVDEVWDYSWSNIAGCARHPHAPLLRFVPPGFYTHSAASYASTRLIGDPYASEHTAALGTRAAHEPRRREPRPPRRTLPRFVPATADAAEAAVVTARAARAAAAAAAAAGGGAPMLTRALFLGDPSLEERARCFVGELRQLVRPVNSVRSNRPAHRATTHTVRLPSAHCWPSAHRAWRRCGTRARWARCATHTAARRTSRSISDAWSRRAVSRSRPCASHS